MLLQEFLPQWAEARKKQVIEAWLNGHQDLATQQVVRGQILGCIFVERLTLGEIRRFYGLDEKPAEKQL